MENNQTPPPSERDLKNIIEYIKKETGAKTVLIAISPETMPCSEELANRRCAGHWFQAEIEGCRPDLMHHFISIMKEIVTDQAKKKEVPGIKSPYHGQI